MVRISQKPLSRATLERIGDLLIYEMAHARTGDAAHAFLESLCTPTERVMLAKRFTAVVMLEEGWSYTAIINTLSMSPSTVARLQANRQAGRYEPLMHRTRSKKKKKQTNDSTEFTLEVLLRGGLPPVAGKGRWKKTFERIDAQRQTARQQQRRKRLPRAAKHYD